jgi:hypothetical protein
MTRDENFIAKHSRQNFGSGLPDFSWFVVPKPEKNVPKLT